MALTVKGRGTTYRLAEMLQDLVRFDTTNPPGNEKECLGYIEGILSAEGFETTLLAKKENRPNLITRLKGRGDAPPLLLYGHVDVVTTAGQRWTHPPFQGKIDDGYLWGRGTLDMKGAVAMMTAALIRARGEGLRPAGDILFAVLSDEEAGGTCGAAYLTEDHREYFEGVRYAIGEFGGVSLHLGAQTFYPIQVAEKQSCFLRATLRGPGSHGARPVPGGAMAKAARFLAQLDPQPLPVHVTPVAREMIDLIASSLPFPKGMILRLLLTPPMTGLVTKLLGEKGLFFLPLLRNTASATILRGSEKLNVIPSEVIIDLDCRLLPGFTPAELLSELRAVVGDEPELEIVSCIPGPDRTDMGLFNMLADILRDADPAGIPLPMLLPAVTDGRIFARLGIQTYGFTPMKLPPDFNFFATIHAADERIPLEALDFGADALYEVIRRYGT